MVHPVQRASTPSKKELRDILIDILKRKLEHEQHDEPIRRLGEHIYHKEADKNFYLVLIRFFDEQNDLFHPNYTLPKKAQMSKKRPDIENEQVFELY